MGDPPRNRLRWPFYLLVGLLVAVLVVLLVLLLLMRRNAGTVRHPTPDAGQVRPEDRGAARDVRADAGRVDAQARPKARPTRIITQTEVRALQLRHRRLLNACYELAARHAPSLVATRVDVTAVLADGGAVRSVRVEGTDDRSLIRCLRSTVKSFRFSGNLRAQEVAFPIIFSARR